MVDPGKRRALGRGLDALLPASRAIPPPPPPPISTVAPKPVRSESGFFAPIEELHPNRVQPRTHFSDTTLDELAASLKQIGMLEPILVRRR